MKDRSDDPSHHERTLLPQSYISLCSSVNLFVNITLKIKFIISLNVSCTTRKGRFVNISQQFESVNLELILNGRQTLNDFTNTMA